MRIGLTHGTRNAYQAGCPCLPCRAANAAYWRLWHTRRQQQQGSLGVKVSAVEAHRYIDALLRERYRKGQLARLLGLKRPILELHPSRITVRTHLKIKRLHRLLLSENAEIDADATRG